MGISPHGIHITGRAAHVSDVTALKPAGASANSHAFKAGPGSMVDHCTIIGGYNCHPFATSGDAQVTNCNVYGTGTNYFAFKSSASSDLIIANNHVWAPGSGLFSGGSVFLEAWVTGQDMDSILITGNQFDTAKGQPHIKVSVLAGCTLRGVNIVGNNSFNNNTVTSPSPWITLDVAATGVLRGLQVNSNMVEGSWDTATSGLHTCLINGAAVAGSVLGSTVSGNFIDRPTVGGYVGFTPNYSGGNVAVDGAGTTTLF